jgi:hypothetical protein
MEMTRSTRMMLGVDEAESNRIIDEALHVALMTTRHLVAWHSGEADAQVSMQRLWAGFSQIRSASGLGLQRDEIQGRRS